MNEIKKFQGLAETYCELIDSHKTMSKPLFLGKCLAILSRLSAAGVQLPEFDCDEELYEKDMEKDGEEWERMFDDLSKKLGKMDKFQVVFDPYQDRKSVTGSLADALADVYQDLKNGISALNNGASISNVGWQWRFDFWNHWGRHATEATAAIYSYLADREA